MCVCEARDILADYLVPNKTLRDTIDRMLESGDSSVDNTGGALQVQGSQHCFSYYQCYSPSFFFKTSIYINCVFRYGICTVSST